MIGPPTNSPSVNCQPSSSARMIAELDHQVGGGELERHRGGEVGALAEERPGQGHRGVGAGRRGRAEAGGDRQRTRRVVRQEAAHLSLRDDGLDRRRQREAQDQRPEDLPEHPERERERVEQVLPGRGDRVHEERLYP